MHWIMWSHFDDDSLLLKIKKIVFVLLAICRYSFAKNIILSIHSRLESLGDALNTPDLLHASIKQWSIQSYCHSTQFNASQPARECSNENVLLEFQAINLDDSLISCLQFSAQIGWLHNRNYFVNIGNLLTSKLDEGRSTMNWVWQ